MQNEQTDQSPRARLLNSFVRGFNSFSALIILPLLFEPAKHGSNDTLDHQFVGRNEVGIFWVFRFEKWFAVLHDKRFQRALAVDERRYDLPRTRLRPVFQHDDVAIENVLPHH